MKLYFKIEKGVKDAIKNCQKKNHIQQVAFSTYHHALTQICFTCEKIRTSIQKGDIHNCSTK